MVKLSEIDLDSGCDESGCVNIDDTGLEEIADYFAEMAFHSIDDEWSYLAEEIASSAIYTALSNPDLISKIYNQICKNSES